MKVTNTQTRINDIIQSSISNINDLIITELEDYVDNFTNDRETSRLTFLAEIPDTFTHYNESNEIAKNLRLFIDICIKETKKILNKHKKKNRTVFIGTARLKATYLFDKMCYVLSMTIPCHIHIEEIKITYPSDYDPFFVEQILFEQYDVVSGRKLTTPIKLHETTIDVYLSLLPNNENKPVNEKVRKLII